MFQGLQRSSLEAFVVFYQRASAVKGLGGRVHRKTEIRVSIEAEITNCFLVLELRDIGRYAIQYHG